MAKSNSSSNPPPGFLAPPNGFAVRMYRQGLGDCFLVAVARPRSDRPFYMLFDCGVHARQDDGPKRLLEVMKDLEAATGGEVDVLIATHQHADHLSGFVQKGNPFVGGRIKVKTFWVAWTEKPGDARAEELRRKHGAARDAIREAIEKLKGCGNTGLAARLHSLMDFEHVADDFEVDPAIQDHPAALAARSKRKSRKPHKTDVPDKASGDEPAAGASNKVSSMELALNFLAATAGEVHYCEPGETLPLGNVPNARAYVLGPPRGDLIKRDLPTGGDDSERKETYLAGGSSQQGFLLAPALGWATPLSFDSALTEDLCHPFDYSLRRQYIVCDISPDPITWKDESKTPTSTREFYEQNYFDKSADWRRIDEDWLGAAEQLALNLDSDTNNTSLVLALEFGDPGEGQVALFVGDAQVGNWLSWTDQPYRAGGQSTTIDDLLGRTIFYKVGHHGSHNATLKRDSRHPTSADRFGCPFGLELMPSTLLAMIPVDRAAAEKKMPIPWHMPHPPLYEGLLRKTAGRVLRADGLDPEPGVKGPPALGPNGSALGKIPGLSNAYWREAEAKFQEGKKTRTCPLYYDVFFGGKPPKPKDAQLDH